MKRALITSVFSLLVCAASFAQAIKGDWMGNLDLMGQKLPLVFHLNEGSGDCTMDSPNQGAKGVAAKIVKNSDSAIEIEVTMIGAKYAGELKDGKIVGKFTQSGMSFDLDLTPGVVERKRPQTPQQPFPYKTEELSFTNDKDGAVLSGTLVTPANAKNAPLVVFVTGSGAQNRDEEIFEHKPFAVIADRLAKSGIASFRYDDRGVGKSGGKRDDLTTDDFRQDALCAVKMLRAKGVAKKIGIIGHSEGGLIAYMVAGEQPKDVNFIISLAGPALDGEKVMTLQINKTVDFALKKVTETTGMAVTDEMKQTAYSASRAAVDKQLASPWYDYFLKYDPATVISKIKCPVFAAFGSKDMQVVAQDNVEALKKSLKVKPADKIKVYEGHNHLFQHAPTGIQTEYAEIEETFSEEVIADIVAWIKASVK
ncbi:MAG: alpha/beta fold hydrolase [Bacteroidaceae bacterium]|nr:alpha/beta fold hydrolase [Bacteroidaceae bacterium]